MIFAIQPTRLDNVQIVLLNLLRDNYLFLSHKKVLIQQTVVTDKGYVFGKFEAISCGDFDDMVLSCDHL